MIETSLLEVKLGNSQLEEVCVRVSDLSAIFVPGYGGSRVSRCNAGKDDSAIKLSKCVFWDLGKCGRKCNGYNYKGRKHNVGL